MSKLDRETERIGLTLTNFQKIVQVQLADQDKRIIKESKIGREIQDGTQLNQKGEKG